MKGAITDVAFEHKYRQKSNGIKLRKIAWFLLVLVVVAGANRVPSSFWLIFCIVFSTFIIFWRLLINATLPRSLVFFVLFNLFAVFIDVIIWGGISRSILVVPAVLFVFLTRKLTENTASLVIASTFIMGFIFTPSDVESSSKVSGTEFEALDGVRSVMTLSFIYLFNNSKFPSRLRTVIFSSLSFFWDGRRFYYLSALFLSFSPWGLLKRPFVIGVLLSALFPIMSIVVSTQTEFSSLWARYRQFLFMVDTIFEKPSLLFFGISTSKIELPDYFWSGDTKFIGSIFEFGIIFTAINMLLIFWVAKNRRLSSFQKFLLGLISFGYLGANPAFFGTAMLLSFVRR